MRAFEAAWLESGGFGGGGTTWCWLASGGGVLPGIQEVGGWLPGMVATLLRERQTLDGIRAFRLTNTSNLPLTRLVASITDDVFSTTFFVHHEPHFGR